MDTLDELVRELAKQRQTVEMYTGLVKEAQGLIEQTAAWRQWKKLAEREVEQYDVLHALEEQVHAAALHQFVETTEKKPHPAVQIKMFTRLDYDPERAKIYCMEHVPAALKLDARAFEKVAKVLMLDWVESVPYPRAQVAGDLSEYLP